MILNNTPDNQAVLSNVQQTSTFAIKATAKSFHILSNGLYANKVRAIIRELSCNAVDSHVAAGKSDVPFDVHLPNYLEPWFSIRDYGVGLDHEQVTSIYTTYFESTKTNSNDFIGALGLGSKSPFSYTDNFTVTAVRNGRRGIYTAFINEHGVPSIALMMEDQTDEPNGVEVKFSVNDRWDFEKFAEEAAVVYQYFSLKPVVSGRHEFVPRSVDYVSRDIVPGVHQFNGYSRSSSIAVMGNIAYPIQVPDSDTSLGALRDLLKCNLELHFNIGELDFQASREGLSYIPQTVTAIRRKLELLNSQLVVRLAEDAEKIDNLWKRADFLLERKNNKLWAAAVEHYIKNNPLDTVTVDAHYGVQYKKMELFVEDLAAKYNIQLSSFVVTRGKETEKSRSASSVFVKQSDGTTVSKLCWQVWTGMNQVFAINDIKRGAIRRTRAHIRVIKHNFQNYETNFYMLSPADRTQAMNVKEFFESIYNPPAELIMKVSGMPELPRRISSERVGIFTLELRDGNNYDTRWVPVAKDKEFDDNETYYYVPIVGHKLDSKYYTDKDQFYRDVTRTNLGIKLNNIYGIRKSDLEWVEEQDNWINLETYIEENIEQIVCTVKKQIIGSRIESKFENSDWRLVLNAVSNRSVFRRGMNILNKVKKDKLFYSDSVYSLLRHFGKTSALDNIDKIVQKYNKINGMILKTYPMLNVIHMYNVQSNAVVVADYINLIDSQKE